MQKIVFITILFFGIRVSVAQQYNFSNIGTNRGLPSSECYGMMQDSRGYMWIRTLNGLGKFDGKKFKNFTIKEGLKSNAIYALFEDKKQRVWFANSSSHIGYIRNDSIFYLPCSERFANENGYGQKVFYQIVADKNFNIYVSSHERAYKFYSNSNYNSYSLIKQQDYYLKIIDINNYPFCLPDTTTKIRPIQDLKFNFSIFGKSLFLNWDISTIKQGVLRNCYPCIDKDKSVYINISNRVFCMDQNGKHHELEFEGVVYHIFIDKDNNLWVGVNSKGLYMYPNCNIEAVPKHLLVGETISGIHQDFEGGIWVSSLNKGIFYCRNLYNENLINKVGLNYKPEMLRIIDSNLFLSDFKSNILKYNLIDKTIEYKKIDFENSLIGILDIDKVSDGYLLSGRNCLYKVDKKFEGLEKIDWEKKLALSSGAYNTIINSNNEIIGISKNYITNYTTGLTNTLPSFGNDIIEYVNYTIAATKNGLFILENEKNNNFKAIIKNENVIKLLKYKEYLIAVCREGKIYLINKYLKNNKTTIGNVGLNDACFVQNDKLIMASNAGIYIFDLMKKKLERLNTSDGLLDNEVFKIAAFKDLAYYSTIYGIGTFSISNRRKNEIAPKIDLSEVVINKAQKFVPNGNYEYHSNINLKFDLISFKETAPLKIFYQLKGYENIWKWSENGDINYTNLPNGDYIFKAYAVNSSGYKSAMYQIPFSIKIPYYKTWWFILSILGAILLLSYSVYRITYYYIDKREVNRTRINKMLAEYQLMGLKAQMNPHFIFNCLNSIQKYVLEHDTKQAYTYMAKFSKLIRFVLDISDKTFVALSDELELVKIYVELEQLRFDNKFEFILTLDGNIDPDEIILPSLLIQPYLENAIWHGIMNLPTNISGEVRINVSAVNHHIEIVITDNGIGRKKAKLLNQKSHQSKGLSINQKRIEAINYLLKTHNATIELIDMFEDNGEPKGTKVIIKLPLKYDE